VVGVFGVEVEVVVGVEVVVVVGLSAMENEK